MHQQFGAAWLAKRVRKIKRNGHRSLIGEWVICRASLTCMHCPVHRVQFVYYYLRKIPGGISILMVCITLPHRGHTEKAIFSMLVWLYASERIAMSSVSAGTHTHTLQKQLNVDVVSAGNKRKCSNEWTPIISGWYSHISTGTSVSVQFSVNV